MTDGPTPAATEASTDSPTADLTPIPSNAATAQPTEVPSPVVTAIPIASPSEGPSGPATTASPTTSPSAATPSQEPVGFELGADIREPTIMSGPDLMARLDPDDPIQAANIADIEALLEATGAGIEQVAMLNANAADGETFVGAVRVMGADTETIKTAYVDSTFDDLGEARIEETEIGGKSATRIYDDAEPDQQPLTVYASGDIVWVLRGSAESVAVVIESLP